MPVCRDKKKYSTEELAMFALASEQDRCIRKRKNKMPQEAYQCPMCKQWHLTSYRKKEEG